jgi:hypothetical protein
VCSLIVAGVTCVVVHLLQCVKLLVDADAAVEATRRGDPKQTPLVSLAAVALMMCQLAPIDGTANIHIHAANTRCTRLLAQHVFQQASANPCGMTSETNG